MPEWKKVSSCATFSHLAGNGVPIKSKLGSQKLPNFIVSL